MRRLFVEQYLFCKNKNKINQKKSRCFFRHKQEREDEAEQFCKNFSLEKLMSMLTLQDGFEEKSGMSLIYKDVIIGEEVDEDEIVYGFGIEKTDKKTLGYNLKSTTRHSCFYKLNEDTSTNPSLNFSDKDDANTFYDK